MTNNNITEEMIEACIHEAATDDAIIDLINVVTDLHDAEALDKAYPEVLARIEAIGRAIYIAMQAASQPPVTMDGLVERAAVEAHHASCANVPHPRPNYDRANYPWDTLPDNAKAAWRAIATAAIEAAGIPTLLATIEAKDEVLAKLRDASRPFADSMVIDPAKQRGDRHWATLGPPTNLDHVLALKEALESQP